MQDMIFFSFLIYSLATSFFVIGDNLFNAMDTILVIGLGMPLHHDHTTKTGQRQREKKNKTSNINFWLCNQWLMIAENVTPPLCSVIQSVPFNKIILEKLNLFKVNAHVIFEFRPEDHFKVN